MSVADEIRKLQELHQTGALSDEEYARAKKTALAARAVAPEETTPQRPAALVSILNGMGGAIGKMITSILMGAAGGVVVFAWAKDLGAAESPTPLSGCLGQG